jgi:hypothetical protein
MLMTKGQKTSMFLTLCLFVSTFATAFAQLSDDDVVGLAVRGLSPTRSKLTWTPVQGEACKFHITYSVYRSTEDNFDPTPSTLVAELIAVNSYVAREVSRKVTYYHVRAVKHSSYCTPPTLSYGKILTYPLDIQHAYPVTIGDVHDTCLSISPTELSCPKLPNLHAVIAEQSGHEFIIGCLSSQYEEGDWTCLNLKSGVYTIVVHSKTITVFGGGFIKQNIKTGQTLEALTPIFTLLGLIS